jgi:hypothetical protein
MSSPPPPTASRGRPSRSDAERRNARRVFAIALAISVLLHLLASVAIRLRIDGPAYAPSPTLTVIPPPAAYEGMRVYDIVPTEGAPASLDDQLRRRTDASPALTTPAGTPDTEAVPRTGAERREIEPVGDRLRPRLGHRDVWTPPESSLEEIEADAVMRRRVAEQLAAFNDSMRIEAEREARATDWTVRDGSGRRWGVSPGRIHLGDVTIPAPAVLTPAGRRDEVRSRIVQWNELQQQAERELVREMFDDRVRAMRERRQAERDSARSAGGA